MLFDADVVLGDFPGVLAVDEGVLIDAVLVVVVHEGTDSGAVEAAGGGK